MALGWCCLAYAQPVIDPVKYAPAALRADLQLLKKQLFDAHADPFTEYTPTQYNRLFTAIDGQITDSLSATEFFKLVRPVMAPLADEHAGISLPGKLADFNQARVFLPFSLQQEKNNYRVAHLLEPVAGLDSGTLITAINGVPIARLAAVCAAYSTGFSAQRRHNALQQFGYLWGLANPFTDTFNLTLFNNRHLVIKGVPANTWLAHVKQLYGASDNRKELITYTRYGETGYINACSFATHNDSEFSALSRVIDSIFSLVRRDGVNRLVIDISSNSGGNSSVGDVLLQHFYSGSYRTYQCNWRRSEEYLHLLQSWGANQPGYQQMKPGSVLHFASDTVQVADNPQRFTGKVYVRIGSGTFSSAIMFATVIKDNALAKLVGQEPNGGHPTHFGELYNCTLPNTGLLVRFGVKQWIRPAGLTGVNRLIPDIPVAATASPEDIAALSAHWP